MKLPGGKKVIWLVVWAIILIFLGYRLFWYAPTVPVIVVKQVEVRGKVHGPATVQSKVPVTLSANITAILRELYADQGDRVQRGQLLAKLDSAELRARKMAAQAAKNRARRDLARAQADVLKAQANLRLARSNYQRDLEVFKPGYISQAAFDTTKAQLKVAESEVAATKATVTAQEAAVKQAESETHAAAAIYKYTDIVAPMDGLITVRKSEIGDTITPGTPIFQMVDLDQIWAAAWIDEAQVAPLQEGQKAAIKLRSGPVFQGEVVRLNKAADTVTRELEVDVKFDKLPHPLVIGEEAEVDIDTGRQTALAVPLAAVITRKGGKGVLVVDQGRAHFQKIATGLSDGKKIAVLKGLKEGYLVVIHPVGLKTGERVRPRVTVLEARSK